MKMKQLNCPNCGGIVEIDVTGGTTHAFCPYCGQKFVLDDEKQEFIINKNVNINNNIHEVYTNVAEVEREKRKDNENKRYWTVYVIVLILCIGMTCAFMFALFSFDADDTSESSALAAGKISAGYYDDLIGKDYKTVEAHFRAAGFTNIELIELNNSALAFWNDGEVETISIGGDTSFSSNDYFDPDVKVVISYH